MTVHSDQLRQMRLAAGYRSARAAALAIGVPVATYGQHESGTRLLSAAQFEFYGAMFIALQLAAEQLREQQQIPDPEALASATYDTLHRARHWRDASPAVQQTYRDAIQAVFQTFGVNLPEDTFRPSSDLPEAP